MFVSHKSPNGCNITTDFYQWIVGSKRCHLEEDEARARAETSITEYGIPLALVNSFKYPGQILKAANNGCLLVVINLRKARQEWARLTRLLGREGADSRTLVHIYLAVVQ